LALRRVSGVRAWYGILGCRQNVARSRWQAGLRNVRDRRHNRHRRCAARLYAVPSLCIPQNSAPLTLNAETEEGALVEGSAVVPMMYCICGYTMLFSPWMLPDQGE
jgi:hypothetical protein